MIKKKIIPAIRLPAVKGNHFDTKTLGLRLVSELVTEQLEGDWHLDPEAGGTCWVITWPMIQQVPLM
ncbi:MAG: hypothetical protein A2277_03355 [Desulfobacterales bacterium RIFOXYA12_FULL_46_15]|nr:MAG: hypothetical protein A2097_06845 [Desulfobacula sp. GWF2_41_7]OGR27377.1 MAG: hypothetical protein A2277_03355 [Desulfobacterales bacterium RIFOXYA12_FULL_46_15]